MSNWFIAIINFVLYSHIFIAACALALTLQTLHIQDIDYRTSPALLGLVFFSTLVIYALHRLVSLHKVDKSLQIDRFLVIGQYRQHIQLYALLGSVGLVSCFFYLQSATQIALVAPALLSLGYVLPFLGKRRLRLRDLHFIKIFLIAIVWSYVTVLLPFIEHQQTVEMQTIGMLIERSIFIFVITLPFDLRDWKIDQHNQVHTIPAHIGVSKTIRLALLLLVIWLVFCFAIYPLSLVLPLAITGLVVAYLLWLSPKQKHDYFFTGLVDGTMLLQAFLVWLLA